MPVDYWFLFPPPPGVSEVGVSTKTYFNESSIDTDKKSFFDLSAAEIEQLAVKATTKARKRMHDKGISTIISVDENVYEEHPDGSLTLLRCGC